MLTHPATSAAGAEASATAPAVEVAASAPGAYSGALTGEGDDPLLEQTAGPRGPAPAPPTRRPRSGHAAARRATIIQTTTAERGTATQDIPPAGTGRTSHYQSRSSRGRAPAQSLHPILPRLTPTPTGSSCSKGHAANALYTTFAAAGLLEAAELDTFVQPGSRLNGHPARTKVPGVEANTGPLGHGLPIAVGDALAAKIDGSPRRVLVLTGDGELQEGSNWEALMAAAQFELDNLSVVADRNHLQQGATTEDTNDLSPLDGKARAFGAHVVDVDAHDHEALLDAFGAAPVEPGGPGPVDCPESSTGCALCAGLAGHCHRSQHRITRKGARGHDHPIC